MSAYARSYALIHLETSSDRIATSGLTRVARHVAEDGEHDAGVGGSP